MSDPFYSPKQDRHPRLVPEEDLLLAKKRIAELEANADLFELQQTIILDTEQIASLEAQVNTLREVLYALMQFDDCVFINEVHREAVERSRAALAATGPKESK